MANVTDIFASYVFHDGVMKERLPKEVYDSLQRTIKFGKHLDYDVANVVANAMKEWAIEKGATHYTHWFQPLNGVTAEKHDSFIAPASSGKIIMEFSGKELVSGETDGSSFPSGGLRATFEARGYTAWDATSYAFIKEKTLCIPTAFCSYGGDALDKKTPLLRSMEKVNAAVLRILSLFGHDEVSSATTTVGPEQEYFLIDSKLYEKRPDLLFTGRTLLGAKAPKGQELDDHYYGVIKPRVKAFMAELDTELWKLGIRAKTEHNEAAPSQHELAPIYNSTNIAVDHDQLTMEVMKKIAIKHGFVCLLSEKPFAGVNGSGKHNNWSISTNTGMNLFEPGDTPSENAQFLLFLVAVIRAVDEYQDLLRISVASAGNDHRLGASEAPPAIISMYLGDELVSILDSFEKNEVYDGHEKELLRVGVHTLPKFKKDNTDRNRTSPVAFTGNKFEFRIPGASESVAECNTIINAAVASVLNDFADILEQSDDFEEALHSIIVDTYRDHKRILFNGNNYGTEWHEEAGRRGLSNYATAPEAFSHFLDEKNVNLLTSLGVLSIPEMKARYEIMMDKYAKAIHIEGRTMVDMIAKSILPAVVRFTGDLIDSMNKKNGLGLSCEYEKKVSSKLAHLSDCLFIKNDELREKVEEIYLLKDVACKAMRYKDEVLPLMSEIRNIADQCETIVSKEYWPFPTYSELLFGE